MRTLLLAPIVLLLACCGGAPESPSEVVEVYLQAAVENDTETMRKLLVENEAAALRDSPKDGEGARPRGGVSFTVGETRIEGDRATVRVSYRIGQGAEIYTRYVCRREGDTWRLSLRDSKPAIPEEP